MRNIKDITINKAIIHIVDNSMEEPIFNQKELSLNEETLNFIGKHIAKASSDEEAKYARFNGNNDIENTCRELIYEENFLEKTKDITKVFFRETKECGLIPSGDLLIVKFDCEYGKTLAIMSMIYNKAFIHSIDYEDENMVIDIKPQYIALPDNMQRLQKSALINFENDEGELLILNRATKEEKAAKSLDTFPGNILKCNLLDDKRDFTKMLMKSSENWVRENLSEDAGRAEEVRREFSSVLKNEDVVDIEKTAKEIFEDEDIAKSYVEALRENGIEDKKVELDRDWVDKKTKRKKLKIDKDVEIHINSDAYEDMNRFQIKRNGDGTIDIIIRQVRNYFEKQ